MNKRFLWIDGKQARAKMGEDISQDGGCPRQMISLVLILPPTALPLMDKLAPFFGWHSVLPFVKERKFDACQMVECICSSTI